MTPREVPFLPKEHNWNNLGKDPLDDTTNQISRLYALLFQSRIFFHVFPKNYVKYVTPGAGLILVPGA